MLVCLTHNNIVDIVHVSFIHILLPQFLMDIIVNIVLFELGHISVCIGVLAPVSGMIVGISGLGKVDGVLLIMYG